MSDIDAEDISREIPRMFRVALRIVGDHDKAHDVVQDACVKALRTNHFDGRSTLATWLYRIAVNCARDHLRKEQRATRDRVSFDGEVAGMASSWGASPEACAETRELYEAAARLVESLPDDCRGAFVLTQLDGYNYDEVAAIENQPRGTIASRVHRAKKILVQQMNDQTQ